MKRYKVWAVKPWGERGEQLIRSGHPYDDEMILLLRTGSSESWGAFEVREPFYGRPMQAVALAYERTGYVGVVVMKDFDDDSWHTGTIGSLGTFLLMPGRCPEMFKENGVTEASKS